MSIFHCAHSKGLEFSAICLDVTVDVITSRSRAICMDVSLDVNFRGPALMRTLSYGMHVKSCKILQLCSQLPIALYDPLGLLRTDVA